MIDIWRRFVDRGKWTHLVSASVLPRISESKSPLATPIKIDPIEHDTQEEFSDYLENLLKNPSGKEAFVFVVTIPMFVNPAKPKPEVWSTYSLYEVDQSGRKQSLQIVAEKH